MLRAARLLVLGTYRPVELILRQHPLKAVKQELALYGHCAELAVGYLTRAEVQAYLAQQGFPVYLDLGRLLHGWALTVQGQADVGLAQLQQGLATYQATRGVLAQHYFVALFADAHGTGGHRAEGLQLVDEALAAVPRSGRFWEAELYRQRGNLLLLDSPTARATDAEACFQQAVGIAQRQGARALELRAALSLSRLWQHQGRRVAARALLAPVYGWFTEGFDTADLQEANALLDELS
jgi:predicted ATPase